MSASLRSLRIPSDDFNDAQLFELRDVGILELLDHDDRPTFLVDLQAPTNAAPVHYNPSLRQNESLQSKIEHLSQMQALENVERNAQDWTFLQWQRQADSVGHGHSIRFGNMYWIGTTLRLRWRIISAVLAVQMVHSDVHKYTTGTAIAPRAQGSGTGQRRPTSTTKVNVLSTPAIKGLDGVNDDYSSVVGSQRKPSQRPPNIPDTRIVQTAELNPIPLDTSQMDVTSNDLLEDPFLSRPRDHFGASHGPLDWTVPNPKLPVSPYTRWFRNFDWHKTKLGPIENWSTPLRKCVFMLLSDPRAAALHWGPHRVMLYNKAYMEVGVGKKHPAMMGLPFSEAWAELGGAFEPVFTKGVTTGAATLMEDTCFVLDRPPYLEETFFSLSVYPLLGDNDEVCFYNPVWETTRQVVGRRRMTFLLSLSAVIAAAGEPKDFWTQLLAGLETNNNEVPFALLYAAEEDMDETMSVSSGRTTSTKHWVIEGSIGYPSNYDLPQRLEPDQAADAFIPSFRERIVSSEPSLLLRSDGSLPEHLVNGIVSRAFGDRCEAAMFCPIRSTGDNVLGFLVLGIDPRRPFDEDYKTFVQLLTRQLATAMATAVLFEEEIRRGRIAAELAELDRNDLSEKLAKRTHEAIETEHRFRRMADLAPVGMFHIAPDGMLVYANEDWYKLTDHPRDAVFPMSWYEVIDDVDHASMDKEWGKLMAGTPVSFELRLKKRFSAAEIVGGEQVEGSTWIIAAAYPEKAEDGTVIGVLGCLTDISRQKWAEDFQTRRMREAVEMKRQQENFIDMTSHEMRNPLSAIIQCADWIGSSLVEYDVATKNVTVPKELIESHIDAAQTIVLCAQHQKRIIDDVLTLSKLDSNLLLITPVDVQPAIVVEKALKMFDSELQKADVELRYVVEESYTKNHIDWVRLDPSRMLQVLINLTTNAIKFTQPEAKRRIIVRVGASKEKPLQRDGLQYMSRNSGRQDLLENGEWGDGELIYLQIEVEDTGRGLSEHEMKLLFQRFSQASPRTHVQYGGSGLGLFISRELTELQGGEIGVRSESGIGSTFAFFIKARRAPFPITEKDKMRSANEVNASTPAVDTLPVVPLDGSSATTVKTKGSPTVSDACRHVLVVEDNLVNQKVLSKQLRSAGCVVSVANHGGEALAFLQESRFWHGVTDGRELSVVLMDLEMPVMDGLTCVKKIRMLQREGQITSHIPVIAVTANARSEQIATAKEAGMDAVVTKPFRIPELIPEMEKLVRKSKMRIDGLERANSAPPLTLQPDAP